mmetsp:Transcript_17071/g.14958  ORF Transcript_17071/g.14958 Transcript_17071/m.14958 type:complete len:120 (+) Transcript_17071:57-416(+)
MALLQNRMWKFLCNIRDEVEKMLFFDDDVFQCVIDMINDGKILTELILFLTTLPLKGFKQNQVLVLLDLGRKLMNEDPSNCRLIFCNNPILTCAMLSYLLRRLSVTFRFMQNDILNVSE